MYDNCVDLAGDLSPDAFERFKRGFRCSQCCDWKFEEHKISVLQSAASYGNLLVIEYLAPETKRQHVRDMLYYACLERQTTVIDHFLAKGIYVDELVFVHNGYSMLRLTTERDGGYLVPFLLERGANPWMRGCDDKSPLDTAVRRKDLVSVKLMCDALRNDGSFSEDITDELLERLFNLEDSFEIMEYFALQCKPHWRQYGSEECVAVATCRAGNLRLLRDVLVRNGLDLHDNEDYPEPPFHVAFDSLRLDVCEYLYTNGVRFRPDYCLTRECYLHDRGREVRYYRKTDPRAIRMVTWLLFREITIPSHEMKMRRFYEALDNIYAWFRWMQPRRACEDYSQCISTDIQACILSYFAGFTISLKDIFKMRTQETQRSGRKRLRE